MRWLHRRLREKQQRIEPSRRHALAMVDGVPDIIETSIPKSSGGGAEGDGIPGVEGGGLIGGTGAGGEGG